MAETALLARKETRWRRMRRRVSRIIARVGYYPRLEIGFAIFAIVAAMASYTAIVGNVAPTQGYTPTLRTILLLSGLVPLMALIVLIARRIAFLLGARRQGRVGARLHVRMVALFASVAAVPTLLVVIFASLLFQFGVQFWFSDRARTVLENADQVAKAYVEENKQRIVADILAMANDVNGYANEYGIDSSAFREGLDFQVAARNLTEAGVFSTMGGEFLVYASVNLDNRPLAQRILPTDLARAQGGQASVIASSSDRVEAVVRIDPIFERYIYVSRKVDPQVLNSVARTQTALSEYQSLIERSKTMQLRFNLMLAAISLLILAATVVFALWLANRLVKPIGRLARAAERVGSGDLSARVPIRGSPDELGTLARAFNRMAKQLEVQTSALDRRRRFTEAVLAGVTAGVLSIDREGTIRLCNSSAEALLESKGRLLIGQKLSDAVPEFAPIFDNAVTKGHAEGQARILRGNETQTLMVQAAAEAGGEGGYVLTFDDISQQLSDQRRAAWADVARRIAHEIKNPLTPIQLSAERLQRRYGKQIVQDPETFASLTGTIVRQVGDLRRMVDEFSSFARMPKPVFRSEPVLDIARQALFMQEVAHPAIRFELNLAEDLPLFVCDRRQIAQALTNLLKNAAEAIDARVDDIEQGHVSVAIHGNIDSLSITITDNGVGIPADLRDRITEPYVTTRARGTGLGLAIVKKIIEEHDGVLELGGNPDGEGTRVSMRFDLAALARRLAPDEGHYEPVPEADRRPGLA